MLTITQVCNKYEIAWHEKGLGSWKVEAQSIDEIHTAIDHLYNRPHQCNTEQCPMARALMRRRRNVS